MKKILIVASALATVATSSAFAQTPRRHMSQYVQSPTYAVNGQYLTNDPYIVIENDRVVGRDPDASIRTQLRRDPVQNEY